MDKRALGQKGPEQITTVEELHDYMQVTNLRLWVFLLVVMSAIVGAIAYASTVTMDNTLQVTSRSYLFQDGDESERLISFEVPEGYEGVLEVGMPVLVGTEPGELVSVDKGTAFAEDKLWAVVELDDGDMVLPDGTYDTTVIIERATALSFLFN